MNAYNTDFGFTSMSISELDYLAVECNSVLGYGSVEKNIYPSVDENYCRDGWKAKIVGKCLDNEAGMMVLRPCNPRTWELWKEGKVKYLMSKGIPEIHARQYTELQVRYVWEDKVIDTVAKCIRRGGYFINEHLSNARNMAVQDIVKRIMTGWQASRMTVTLDDLAA